jgi:hypothetical protein
MEGRAVGYIGVILHNLVSILIGCYAVTRVTDKSFHLLLGDTHDLVHKDLALDFASFSSYFLFLLLLKL